jgi:hypothetical protein
VFSVVPSSYEELDPTAVPMLAQHIAIASREAALKTFVHP